MSCLLGTEKQHVALDYAQRLSKGQNIASNESSGILTGLLAGPQPLDLDPCFLLNESTCVTSEQNDAFTAVVYNTRAIETTHLIKIPVSSDQWVVQDHARGTVDAQVFPTLATIVPTVQASPYYIAFQATLPAIGHTTFTFRKPSTAPSAATGFNGQDQQSLARVMVAQQQLEADDHVIGNDLITVTFDGTTGLLKSVLDKVSGKTTQLTQEYLYYESYVASNKNDDNQNSGAYIFRPASDEALPTCGAASAQPKVTVFNKYGIQEVRQQFCDWSQQTVRIVPGSPVVEFEYQIGSVPLSDGIGKEVITRFTSDLNSDSTWYTDSNGREMIKRVKNHRDTWDYQVNQNVSGNYVPVNAAIYLNDIKDNRQLSIVNDRSQGGASLNNGELELMVHRRILADDRRGVGEPLNETIDGVPHKDVGVGFIGSHYLQIGNSTYGARQYRNQMNVVFNEPILTFHAGIPQDDVYNNYNMRKSFSKTELPANVELMTLQPYPNGQTLVRVASQYAVNEDPEYSKVVSFDLAQLFQTPITKAVEMSLTANQPKAEAKARQRYELRVEEQDLDKEVSHRGAETVISQSGPDGIGELQVQVSLGPMEIKTFLVNF